MSKHKYGMQKPVQNDLQQCINSFERMKRGGIGIADELVCDTCKRALKYIDALEAKLAESESVCHGYWVYDHWCEFKCSECGEPSNSKPYKGKENFCPKCGARMDGKEAE